MTRTSDWVPSSINQRLAPSGTPIIRISPQLRLPLWLLLSIAEYSVAIIAVTNVILITYTLSVNAVIEFAPKTLSPLPSWLGLAVGIHIASSIILSLRIQMKHPQNQRWASTELVPCVFQAPGIVESRSGKGFYIISSAFGGCSTSSFLCTLFLGYFYSLVCFFFSVLLILSLSLADFLPVPLRARPLSEWRCLL